MPAPLAILLAFGGVLAAEFGKSLADSAAKELGQIAAQEALEKMGIPLDLSGEVNQFTITQAINQGVLNGELEFTNLFDKEAVKADIKRIAIEQAGRAFGYEGGLGIEAIKIKLVTEVIRDAVAEARAGAGVYVEAAKPLSLNLPQANYKSQEIRNFTKKGENNRERQARYRASHRRVWL